MRSDASHASNVSPTWDGSDRSDDALGTKLVPRRPSMLADTGKWQKIPVLFLGGPRVRKEAIPPPGRTTHRDSYPFDRFDLASRDRLQQAPVVELVLVGVERGEAGDRAVEALTFAEVGSDRESVTRAGM